MHPSDQSSQSGQSAQSGTPSDAPSAATTRRPARRRAAARASAQPPSTQPARAQAAPHAPLQTHASAALLLPRVRWTLGAVLLALLLWAALWPLRYPTRERIVDFPRGAALLKGRGGAAPVPSELRLTLGVRDVLLLRNRDLSAHVFGQVLVLPGRTFRLPFEGEGEFVFACDAAPGNAVRVRVLAQPDPGWGRLRWRLDALADAVRDLPVRGPQD